MTSGCYGCDDAQPSTALGTQFNIHLKYPLQSLSPGKRRKWRVVFYSSLRFSTRRVLAFLPCLPVPKRYNEVSVSGIWCQYAVIAGEIGSYDLSVARYLNVVDPRPNCVVARLPVPNCLIMLQRQPDIVQPL